MAWVYLGVAGLLEVVWAVSLKYTDGFSKLWPSVFTVVMMVASFVCLALAQKTLPLGTSYAVWTGIGVLGTAVLGVILFSEAVSLARLGCIVLILVGIVGLRLTAGD